MRLALIPRIHQGREKEWRSPPDMPAISTPRMGGLFLATLLTLLFQTALYAACFRVQRPEAAGYNPAH